MRKYASISRHLKLLFIMLFSFNIIFSQDKTTTKFGNGIYNVIAADSSWKMNFSARFQTLYTGKWILNDTAGFTNSSSNFNIRRARLKFEGFAYSPKLQYKIELGLSNRDISGASSQTSNSPNIIFDALLKWNFYKNMYLWLGQTKLPGNRERVISSGNLQLVDRSLLNNEFNIDRDLGIQLRHNFKLGNNFNVREMVAVSQGEGRNVTSQNIGGFQWTGRIEILPFGKFEKSGDYSGGDLKREKKPKLSLAASYDYNEGASKTKGNMGHYMKNDIGYYTTDISTIFIDAIFNFKGLSLMTEYANRTSSSAEAINSDSTKTGDAVNVGSGVNAQIGYLFKNNIELAFRYTVIDLNKSITGKDIETQYTLGLSKYIVGHKLKVQADVSYTEIPNDADKEIMGRIQIDIHF